MLIYYGIFNHAEEGGFNVSFPDVEGALTCGGSMDEAVDMAVDVLSIALTSAHESQIHPPSSYEAVLAQTKPGDLVLPITPRTPVEADFRPRLPVSVQLPECQLRTVDKLAKLFNYDRSVFITHALDGFLAAYYADVKV